MTKNEELKNKEIDLVKHQLWRNGYSTKDVSNYTDYDLLVEGLNGDKIKVEVKSTVYNKKSDYWLLDLNKKDKTKKVDVLAIIISTALYENVIYYMNVKQNLKNLGSGKLKINSEIIRAMFTTSPAKIFNKN